MFQKRINIDNYVDRLKAATLLQDTDQCDSMVDVLASVARDIKQSITQYQKAGH